MNTQPQTQTPSAPAYSDKSFLHTLSVGVILPLVQSFATSIIFMIVTATVLYWTDAIDYLKPMVTVGALSFAGMWLFLQRRWLNLTNLERLTRIDFNGDGRIAEEPRRVHVQIDRVKENGHLEQSAMYDLEATDDEMEYFAQAWSNGKPFTEDELAGGGKYLSQPRFAILRADLFKRKLIEKKGKTNKGGFKWTQEGEEVLKAYAPPPLSR